MSLWWSVRMRTRNSFWCACFASETQRYFLPAYLIKADMSKLQSWPSACILRLIIYVPPALFYTMNRSYWKCNSSFRIMVAAPLCNSVWLCEPCCEPSLLISGMATVNKKGKADTEARRFKGRWTLQYLFSGDRINCVCLICQVTAEIQCRVNSKQNTLRRLASSLGPQESGFESN